MENPRFHELDHEHEPFLKHSAHNDPQCARLVSERGIARVRRSRQWLAACASHGAAFFIALALVALLPSVRLSLQSLPTLSSRKGHRTLWCEYEISSPSPRLT